MGEAGAIAEFANINVKAGERLQDTSEQELVARVRKVGESGNRSAALRDAFEQESFVEKNDTPYALSRNATSFLSYILPDTKPSEQLFRPNDVEHIIEALLLVRGPIRSMHARNLDYRAGLEALFSPDSSYAQIAEEVFHNSTNAAYMSLLQFARKCRASFEPGASVEDLIHVSNADYQLEFIERPAEQLLSARQKDLGRQSVKATQVVAAPVPQQIPVPTTKADRNNPFQYASEDPATPRDTEDTEPLAWQRDALCSQTDPEAFFPEKGGSTRDVKRICADCDVRDKCLDYALGNDEQFGIWGGLSERERRKLKRSNAS